MTNYDPMNVKITTNKDLTYVLNENERKMLLEDAPRQPTLSAEQPAKPEGHL